MTPHERSHAAGVTWTLPGEAMTRSWHALADGGHVWLVDPVDAAGVVERAQKLGRIEAVVQLLDRHNRDCAPLAARLGVPLHKVPRELPGTPFEVMSVLSTPVWKEAALWWPERSTLVVAESVASNPAFAVGDDALGVHPLRRLFPPGRLGAYAPETVLVGHGPPVTGPDAAAALRHALGASRRDIPRLLLQLPRALRADRL